MSTMNASYFIEKVGHGVLNTFLLAALPTALVASTYPLDVVEQMIADGHPFFTGLAGGQVHALPTGHWPMLSEPKALADLLDRVAGDRPTA